MGVDLFDRSSDVPEADQPAYVVWVRTRGEVSDDRVLNACITAYVSDLGAGGVAALVVGLRFDGPRRSELVMASVDHALWFHRPNLAHDWLLIDSRPVSTAGSRGLVRGTMHDATGRHVASFAQELLVRERL
jgi:acyl-CoA thioesterase-2